MRKTILVFCTIVLTLLLLSFGSIASAEKWQSFSKTHSPGFRIYYDTDSIKVDESGNVVSFRIKSLNPQLAGLVQICDIVVTEKSMRHPSGFNFPNRIAVMSSKKVYDQSGKLIKEEPKETLGSIIGGNWDFLDEALVYAGKNGLYPKGKELNLDQHYWNYVLTQKDGVGVYYEPDKVKSSPEGLHFEILFRGDPLCVTYEGYYTKDGGAVITCQRKYYGMFYSGKEQMNRRMANITNPSDLKAKQAVIAYRDKHNL